MGTGKTAVGKKLADVMNRTFVDIDNEIELGLNCSINEIFEKYGEKEFRKIEGTVLENIVKRKNLIVSTGGGIILNIENMDKMKQSGLVVTLIARPEVICERLQGDSTRPLLSHLDEKEKLEEIRKLIFIRAGLYSKGDFIIDTSDLSIESIVAEIMEFYNAREIKS
jgi:shikimate kinase